MRIGLLGTVLLGALVPGCDSEGPEPEAMEDDYLDREVATSIPDGDASGNTFSGNYQMRSTVVSCVGACGPIEIGGTTYAVCERDLEFVEWVSVYQDGGSLRVDLDDDGHIGINLNGYVPVRLLGGIDADGGWDIGGYGTKFGGTLESVARARGTVDETLAGTLEVQSFGIVEGAEVDCHAVHDIEAMLE